MSGLPSSTNRNLEQELKIPSRLFAAISDIYIRQRDVAQLCGLRLLTRTISRLFGVHIMSKDFLPSKDDALLVWANDFITNGTPIATSIGLTVAQFTAFGVVRDAYANDLAAALNPMTRTRGAISTKNDSRTALRAAARDLARIVNAFPGTTNTERLNLGLTPRSGTSTPIQPPQESPIVEVVSANGRTLKVRLHAQDTTRRGRPIGVDGATVLSFVGNAPPADIAQWKFEGSTTRNFFDCEFPASVPAGSQVFLTAFWFNPRSQSGPAATPISAYLAGGVTGSQQQGT